MMSRAATGTERLNLERYLERVDKDIEYVKNELGEFIHTIQMYIHYI